ncbi:ABC transporter ATP-binding protein [Nodosilinea sp. LEGE 07088]|uniref:ABC transporter ATP-binding protein n=1 Tax=Nodosilinea sp. LEGE 07088 TaxID=2777968 RepID=UPI0018809BAE|nr:ABC transporter ATP-binding protein [Nodosilinea sp. LEGE 07088]MBE9135949.1 ABC transporter ATP-binding protein [Nodosilinea sp. LEGE 07088]
MAKPYKSRLSQKRLAVNPPGIQPILRRIWQHLNLKRRWQLLGLAALMVTSGIAEAITLGAVLPFLSVIVAPEKVLDNPTAMQLYEALGFTSSEQLVLPLTIALIVAALLAGIMRLLVLWATKSYGQMVGHEMAVNVYWRTLYQPYRVHLARNTSELISSIEKITVVIAVLNHTMALISALVIVTAIVVVLLAIEPLVSAATFLGLGGLYGLLIYSTRKRLNHNSRQISRQMTLQIKALQEGLGGIRDVLLDHSQPFYCERYRRANWPLCRARAENAFIGSSPRYGVETLGLVVLAGLAYGLSQQSGGGAAALPLLGTLALGAQRLMPALQQIFAAWAGIRGDQTAVEDVLKLLEQSIPPEELQPSPPPLRWQSTIKFIDVGFRYNSTDPWILQALSFTIPKGARVGVVGATGSGKSTTLDILMGLLEPTVGEVVVDNRLLKGDRSRAWQQTIAHVPQHIYLADTTIAENIALGVPKQDIDLERVRFAAQQAKIAAFIEQSPDGYSATLGERGIRLSGGQRQRVGIARALYKKASVLVFDEATSALDSFTEQEVMAAIENLGDDLTILLIAHRLSTVEQCDFIIELAQGRVVAQGNYQELLEKSESFKRMAML